jgi:hypothetical protein
LHNWKYDSVLDYKKTQAILKLHGLKPRGNQQPRGLKIHPECIALLKTMCVWKIPHGFAEGAKRAKSANRGEMRGIRKHMPTKTITLQICAVFSGVS